MKSVEHQIHSLLLQKPVIKVPMFSISDTAYPALELYAPDEVPGMEFPFAGGGIAAGFPSSADSFPEERLSLDSALVRNKAATFFARVRGQSMIDAGIDDGDLLIIDRSLQPSSDKIAVCLVDGEFTVKRLKVEKNAVFLMPENQNFRPLKIEEEDRLIVWGMVTHVIKKVTSPKIG